MLTGEVPHGVFDPPSKKAPIDARLDPVVLRAMQEEPDRRYQQAVELRAEVDRVDSSPARHAIAGLRKGLLWAMAGAIFAAIGALVWWKAQPPPAHLQSAKAPPHPPASRWTNSLGMKFVPLGNEGVQICVWETRVRDFEQFAANSGFETQGGLYTLVNGEWTMVPSGLSWRQPGFEQSLDHPVCGVDWNMAQTFCRWLTERERRLRLLPASEAYYRLPTEAEWSLACALSNEPAKSATTLAVRYPWGTAFPPPAGTGNFAGEEALTGPWPAEFPTLTAYRDEFRTTAPVGSFRENPLGLADIAGNLWEWCEDGPGEDKEMRWLRGGSWVDGGRKSLGDGARARAIKQTRTAAFGFRIVLAPR